MKNLKTLKPAIELLKSRGYLYISAKRTPSGSRYYFFERGNNQFEIRISDHFNHGTTADVNAVNINLDQLMIDVKEALDFMEEAVQS